MKYEQNEKNKLFVSLPSQLATGANATQTLIVLCHFYNINKSY